MTLRDLLLIGAAWAIAKVLGPTIDAYVGQPLAKAVKRTRATVKATDISGEAIKGLHEENRAMLELLRALECYWADDPAARFPPRRLRHEALDLLDKHGRSE